MEKNNNVESTENKPRERYANSGRSNRFSFGKKQCYFKKNNIREIDYKDINLLRKYIGKTGKIMPKRFTGVSPRAQRVLSTAIKRARFMALLPYTGEIYFLEKNYPRKKIDRNSSTYVERNDKKNLRR